MDILFYQIVCPSAQRSIQVFFQKREARITRERVVVVLISITNKEEEQVTQRMGDSSYLT